MRVVKDLVVPFIKYLILYIISGQKEPATGQHSHEAKGGEGG